MDVPARQRSARVRLVVIGVVLSVLATIGSVAWAGMRSRTTIDRPASVPGAITNEMFALVGEGMRPADVEAVLGRPSRRTVSLAEGFAWPEPKDMCWYFPSIDRTREYQVCFIAWKLVTRGSYPVGGREPG